METEVNVTWFKAHCLAMIDEVARGEASLILTRRGVPVARVVPVDEPPTLVGSVTFNVDDVALVEPLDVAWEASS
jgi:prevent-host-death family protein